MEYLIGYRIALLREAYRVDTCALGRAWCRKGASSLPAFLEDRVIEINGAKECVRNLSPIQFVFNDV